MAKSIFEGMGGTYHEENGYLIPDLTLPAKKEGITEELNRTDQMDRSVQ